MSKEALKKDPVPFPLSSEIFKKSFEKGSVIFRQGDIEGDFYIIEKGKVGIFLVQNGNITKISELGPGGSFGEFALLGEKKRSASVKALTNVTVYKVSEKGFNELLSQLPDWAVCMLKNFVKRIRVLDKRVK